MIQRVQSVYLMLAFCCTVLLIWFPLFSTTAVSNEVDNDLLVSAEFGAYGLVFANETNSMAEFNVQYSAFGQLADNPQKGRFPVYIVFIGLSLLTFGSIFLYARRKRQLLFCRLNLILHILILIGVYAFYYLGTSAIKKALPETADLTITFTLELGFYLLLASIPFLLLAIRGIRNDENLVKSLDRLR